MFLRHTRLIHHQRTRFHHHQRTRPHHHYNIRLHSRSTRLHFKCIRLHNMHNMCVIYKKSKFMWNKLYNITYKCKCFYYYIHSTSNILFDFQLGAQEKLQKYHGGGLGTSALFLQENTLPPSIQSFSMKYELFLLC